MCRNVVCNHGVEDNATLHVLGHRQTEEVAECRCDLD
jgi:hypothetical protein